MDIGPTKGASTHTNGNSMFDPLSGTRFAVIDARVITEEE